MSKVMFGWGFLIAQVRRLMYGGRYSDARYGSDDETKRGRLGYAFMSGGVEVSCSEVEKQNARGGGFQQHGIKVHGNLTCV